ncbi:MAG: DUF2973 domain-containing protein, partial [Cyanobacteria bacterium J06633_23]
MLHLLYIFAFTVLAVLAIANLVRNLISLGIETRRGPGSSLSSIPKQPRPGHCHRCPKVQDGTPDG